MTTDRLFQVLLDLPTRLSAERFTLEPRVVATSAARAYANSTFPAQLFCAWLARTPEAIDVLKELLAPTQPDPETSGQNFDAKPTAIVRGAAAEPVVVNIGNAASVLGQSTLQTRRVKPDDLARPGALGEGVTLRGAHPVTYPDGSPLRARAKFKNGIHSVEFLDKRGPIILMRITDGPSQGIIINGTIDFVCPEARAEVLAALSALPMADAEFENHPFDDVRDPWVDPMSPRSGDVEVTASGEVIPVEPEPLPAHG